MRGTSATSPRAARSTSARLSRRAAATALLALALGPLGSGCAAGFASNAATGPRTGAAGEAPTTSPAPTGREPIWPPFPHALFDRPFVLAGTFGDYRSNHFHAGLDLDTRRDVGWAVHAPIDGQVRRVRASGVGYGRSLYIESADGRLLVFGHLDAFAEPVASYLAMIQDSAGQYEQDLWPEPGRFRVRAGDVVAWTGRSGTGGPHLHFEVRRGDMAMHPLRAGLAWVDTIPPRIERVTVVPLDDTSFAAGARAPVTLDVTARDSARLAGWGRLRMVVEAQDADSDGDLDISPWRLRLAWGDEWVECRFDSVSWATDMAQSDYLWDRGRVTAHGKTSLLLAAPAGFRPRVLESSAPERAEAGVIRLDGAHRERIVTIEAEDLAGHVVRRAVVVRAERPARAKATPRARVHRVASHRAELDVRSTSAPDSARLSGLATLTLPAGALFEPGPVTLERLKREKGTRELIPLGPPVLVAPTLTPARAPVELALWLPHGARVDQVALYRDAGDGWEFLSDDRDPTGRALRGSTRRLGRFGLFRDTLAPRVDLVPPLRTPPRSPYPRWGIEARLTDDGSGVDARSSAFEIDGRRVPSEWDSVVGILRWRPLRTPASGSHRVVVVAVDRSRNVRRTSGAFVLE